MLQDSGREQAPVIAQPVTWFVPDRPVGGTVFVRPVGGDAESEKTCSAGKETSD